MEYSIATEIEVKCGGKNNETYRELVQSERNVKRSPRPDGCSGALVTFSDGSMLLADAPGGSVTEYTGGQDDGSRPVSQLVESQSVEHWAQLHPETLAHGAWDRRSRG